jgi:hypothetical protein
MKLPGGTGDSNGASGSGSNASGSGNAAAAGGKGAFSNFSKIVDPSGSLNFQNKAVLHAKGVDFSNGSSFNINMDELQLQDELGSGAYGTVQKVYHKVTKVTMAMKVRLNLSCICTWEKDMLKVRCVGLAGNPPRAGRLEAERYHHGVGYSTPCDSA